MSSQPAGLLPDYFPGVVKACADVGETFFECFTEHAAKKSPSDTTSGITAVETCKVELQAYKKCMDGHVTKLEGKKFRVSQPLPTHCLPVLAL